jgi:effector-binding domain-containing protein
MTVILITPALIIFGVLVYLACLNGDYEVRRSLLMNVDRQTVFNKICDFRSWAEWSPWLMHEPDTRLEYSDAPEQEGGWYTWDGTRVGAGKLTHVKIDSPERIEERIEFLRPFKSTNSVWWEFAKKNGQTEVSWNMKGTMPFFFRFMAPMMTMMIGKDYDLGLALLRGKLDPQAEKPDIRFEGEAVLESRHALTIPFKGGMDEMITAMTDGFPKLAAHVEQSGSSLTGMPFTAYHKVNPKTKYFECDIAVPVAQDTADGDFVGKSLGAGKYFQVSVSGSYNFLELAWYSAMSHIRMLKFKMDKSRPSLEVYENDPDTVAHTNEIQTTLYVPIR